MSSAPFFASAALAEYLSEERKRMTSGTITLCAPPRFSFWHTVHSHGWCVLPPFSTDSDTRTLRRLLTLSDGTLVSTAMRSTRRGRVTVAFTCTAPLSLVQRREVKAQLHSCLRFDDDLTAFYRYASRLPAYRWIPRIGAGRMLRAPTVFEDAVKMICTTNCSWELTEAMTRNLIRSLGNSANGEDFSFPSPQAIAAQSESFIRTHVRAGYRAPYLIELSERVASGKLDIESWRHSPLATESLFEEMRSVKGIGAYAAGNLLKLVGRYDELGLDSWVRSKFAELHHRGRRVSDRTIERFYANHGEWRGLLFWLEMTREWYDHGFPF